MSEKKNLPANVSPERKQLLNNSGLGSRSLLDLSMSNLTTDEMAAVRGRAIEEKLRLEIDAEQRSFDYQLGRKVAEDHIDTFSMLEKGGPLTRQKVVSDIKTGAGNMRLESRSGASCFVATAAYGDNNHENVVFLRWYRDSILELSWLGRVFIALYWRVGPVLAGPVKRNRSLQLFSRSILDQLVKLLRRS